MAVSPVRCRWMLAACVVLVVAVALVVAVGVIPLVRVTIVPDISPEDAVPAFWTAVGLHLLAALVLLLIATLSKGRSRFSTPGLVVTGIAVLLFGFVLSDAALALLEAGPSVQTVTTLLLLCVAADALAGALTITTAFLRPRTPREGLTSALT
jgi:hypothetical protein